MRTNQEILDELKKKDLHFGKGFIDDGIIDESKWSKINPKVMLILKEAYGDQKEEWSLTELIRDEWEGPKHKIWWTVSYWLYAIHKTRKDTIPEFPLGSELDACKAFLLSSAIVNVKKSFGISSSNDEDLQNYVRSDHKLIKEQIEAINPDIILCGNTSNYLKEIMEFPDEQNRWNLSSEIIYKKEKYTIIDFWHPANLYPDTLCYYALTSLLQNAKKVGIL